MYVWFCLSNVRNNFVVASQDINEVKCNFNENWYSQKIQQPKTSKNIWSRLPLNIFTVSSSAVNSAVVISAILTSARRVVANDIGWFVLTTTKESSEGVLVHSPKSVVGRTYFAFN